MGLDDPLRLSIGEWIATCRGWAKAHGAETAAPPSDDEFEAAIMAARR